MYHPSRGGVRGGRDQFNWDDVKADKHRENYLGHSLKAPVGRWQKGKDLMWYARDGKQTAAEAAASAREEIERVKQEEDEAMREALGLAPRRDKPRVNRLDKREQEELLKRSKPGEEVEKPYAQGERVQGLGFAPVTKTLAPDKKDLLQREAVPEEERPLAQIIAHSREAEKAPVADAVNDEVTDDHDKKRKRKEEKRAAKEQRREEKKAAKKVKREKRRRRQTSTSSDEELSDKVVSRTKNRRHESDSSDEDQGHITIRRAEPAGNKRNTTAGHERYSSDDEACRRTTRDENESGYDTERPSRTTRVAAPERNDHHRAERSGRRLDERERKHGRAHDGSSPPPRQRHDKHDDYRERSGKYSRSSRDREIREVAYSRRDSDDEGTRRRYPDERDNSKDIDRHRRRSPSNTRRKPRQDSD